MLSEFNKLCGLYADREYVGKVINLNNVSHSTIRELEIEGETKEVGNGDKSPDNPYELVRSKPELKICGRNLYKPVFGVLNKNINFDGEWFSVENFTNSSETTSYNLNFYTTDFSMIADGEYTIISEISEIDISGNTSSINFVSTADYSPSNAFSVFNSSAPSKITTPTKIIEYKEANTENATLLLRSYISIPVGVTIKKLKWRMVIYKGYISEENYIYKPYKEQDIKMISKNLYDISETKFSDLALEWNIDEENGTLSISNLPSFESGMKNYFFSYALNDDFKPNTAYTFVVEILEATYN